MTETRSSSEATDREKALIDDLHPWPFSLEEAWAVAHKHMGDLELGYRIYRREGHEQEAKLNKIRRYLDSIPSTPAHDDVKQNIFAILDHEFRNPEEGI